MTAINSTYTKFDNLLSINKITPSQPPLHKVGEAQKTIPQQNEIKSTPNDIQIEDKAEISNEAQKLYNAEKNGETVFQSTTNNYKLFMNSNIRKALLQNTLNTAHNNNISNIFNNIQEVVAKELGIDSDTINLESNLEKDLPTDSIGKVNIVLALENKFNCEIPNDKATEFKTIKDFVSFINSQLVSN